MRHHAIAAAMGLVTAAVLAPCSQSQAASADPTGYWYKPDAERESKIQVFKCGKAKSQLCAKIIWLKDPNDSKGKALHDVRNEDPSMRDRPIVGLTIFSGLAPSAPDTWTGQVYNPEDGHIYAATLRMVSRKEINLKGCKAWLLCGEKQWLRTTAPQELTPATPAATPQIEASADPSAAPSVPSGAAAAAAPAAPSTAEASTSAAPSAEAAAAPGPETVREASAEPQSAPAEPQPVALPKAELATPAAPPAEQDKRPGYGFLNASTAPETTARVSGENVSSMFDMTKPIAAGSVAPVPAATAAATPIAATAAADPSPAQTSTHAADQADDGVPLPTQKPKAKTIATASAKPAAKTVTSTSAKPAEQAAPAPRDSATAEADAADTSGADSAQATTAEASMADTAPLTRRQKRLLRKRQRQEEPFLPWLQQ
jgi:uncharacterized protein (DUF2147 family)